MFKKKIKGFEKLALEKELDWLVIERRDSKSRLISEGIETW